MIENLGLRNAFILIAVLGEAVWCTAIMMISVGMPAGMVEALVHLLI